MGGSEGGRKSRRVREVEGGRDRWMDGRREAAVDESSITSTWTLPGWTPPPSLIGRPTLMCRHITCNERCMHGYTN